jgi:hypothetical protein
MLNQRIEIIAVFDFTPVGGWAVNRHFLSLKSLKKQPFIELTGQDFSQPINCRARLTPQPGGLGPFAPHCQLTAKKSLNTD